MTWQQVRRVGFILLMTVVLHYSFRWFVANPPLPSQPPESGLSQ